MYPHFIDFVKRVSHQRGNKDKELMQYITLKAVPMFFGGG